MGATLLMANRRIYDGEKLFKAYMGMGRAGSYPKLKRWAEENGMINPLTGRATKMGLFWSMWKWAFHNPEEAYPIYKEWASQYTNEIAESGFQPTWENFLKEIQTKVKHRREIVSQRDYEEFCIEYNLTP